RIHDGITILFGLPGVVHVVGVVVRNAAEPYHRVIRRQPRDHQSRRRTDDDKTGAAWRIPDAAAEIVVTAAVIVRAIILGQARPRRAHGRVVVAVIVAAVQYLTAPVIGRPRHRSRRRWPRYRRSSRFRPRGSMAVLIGNGAAGLHAPQ